MNVRSCSKTGSQYRAILNMDPAGRVWDVGKPPYALLVQPLGKMFIVCPRYQEVAPELSRAP